VSNTYEFRTETSVPKLGCAQAPALFCLCPSCTSLLWLLTPSSGPSLDNSLSACSVALPAIEPAF
jgi:hypothetical protein